MPTISNVSRNLIRMFFFDMDKHNVPHIHAEYQDSRGRVLHSGWRRISWRATTKEAQVSRCMDRDTSR